MARVGQPATSIRMWRPALAGRDQPFTFLRKSPSVFPNTAPIPISVSSSPALTMKTLTYCFVSVGSASQANSVDSAQTIAASAAGFLITRGTLIAASRLHHTRVVMSGMG
jgi:hypothetical protein